jgi:hypothetical protein
MREVRQLWLENREKAERHLNGGRRLDLVEGVAELTETVWKLADEATKRQVGPSAWTDFCNWRNRDDQRVGHRRDAGKKRPRGPVGRGVTRREAARGRNVDVLRHPERYL